MTDSASSPPPATTSTAESAPTPPGGIVVAPAVIVEDRVSYSTPPPATRWQRFIAGAFIGLSHLIAGATILAILVLLPTFAWAVMLAIDLIHSAAQLDGPPPIAVPFLFILGFILGAIVIALAGAVLGAIIMCAGICADSARRSLRCPFWLVPFIIAGLNVLAWLLFFLTLGEPPREASVVGMWTAGAFTLLFTLYWTALFFSDRILLLAYWLLGWLFESLRQWWKGRKARQNPAP